MDIAGTTIVISGASSGIGAASAHLLALRGARVLLLARTAVALEALAAEITSAGGAAAVYPVDLADLAAVARVTAQIRGDWGTPDILVNNAGAGRWLAIEETDPREALQMMAVPYLAAFALTQAFTADMLARRSGWIVNVTSAASYGAWPGATGYIAARWALRGFDQGLRMDLAGTGIGVTLVTSTVVSSAYFDNNPGSADRIPGLSSLFGAQTPEAVALAIMRGIERRKKFLYLPRRLGWVLAWHRAWSWPVDWLVRRTGWRRPPSSPS